MKNDEWVNHLMAAHIYTKGNEKVIYRIQNQPF